jgi:predicted nuclease of predicted toxin-antitoxin system
MRCLVDNSMSPRFADSLRAAGHEAVHVRDLGLSTADDTIIFDRAAAEDRIVIAQDTDFGTILALRQAARPSVILFRCQIKSTDVLTNLLMANLSAILADLDAGAIVVFEDTRIRTRRLPLTGGKL